MRTWKYSANAVCTSGSGEIAGVRLALISSGLQFTDWDASGNYVTQIPDPADVKVTSMEAGDLPLFLFGGAFYPLSQLPVVVQWAAKVAPLWHGVVVARAWTIGSMGWPEVLGHLAYITLFVVVGTAWAVRNLRRKLYP